MGCDPSSRVGACGRRPSESADPGGSASWGFYRAGIGCTVEKKLYGGRGLRLVGGPHMSSGFPDWWFYPTKMKDFASGTVPVSDWCPSRLSEVSRRAFASSREAQSGQKCDQYGTNLSSREAKRGLKVS